MVVDAPGRPDREGVLRGGSAGVWMERVRVPEDLVTWRRMTWMDGRVSAGERWWVGGAPAACPVRVLCEPTLRSSTPRVYSPPTSAHAGVLSLSLAGCGVVSGVWFILRLLPVRYGVVDSFVWGESAGEVHAGVTQ